MLPARGAGEIFGMERHAKRKGIGVENLPASGEGMTKRAVEVEEDGFNSVG